MLATLKAERDANMKQMFGMVCAIGTMYDKSAINPYFDMMYSPAEREEFNRIQRERQEKEMAMLMAQRMRMMMAKYDIQEVKERWQSKWRRSVSVSSVMHPESRGHRKKHPMQ